MTKRILDILMDEAGKGGAGGSGGNPPPPPPTFDTLIPDEFKDRPYLSDLKTLPVGPDAYGALFKKLDGAQTLIGKKGGIPEPTAPETEWNAFLEKIRPSSAEEYEIKVGEKSDPEFVKSMKGLFHGANLSKIQAAKLAAGFDAFVTEKTAVAKAEAEKLDQEFAKYTKEAFGADTEKVLERSRVLLNELTPAAVKPHLAKLPNEALVVLAGVMETVRAKYLKEDGGVDGKGSGGGTDPSALRDEGRTLMASDAYKNAFHKDHDKVKSRVAEIYSALGGMAKK